jgi:hypothetical protein
MRAQRCIHTEGGTDAARAVLANMARACISVRDYQRQRGSQAVNVCRLRHCALATFRYIHNDVEA